MLIRIIHFFKVTSVHWKDEVVKLTNSNGYLTGETVERERCSESFFLKSLKDCLTVIILDLWKTVKKISFTFHISFYSKNIFCLKINKTMFDRRTFQKHLKKVYNTSRSDNIADKFAKQILKSSLLSYALLGISLSFLNY